jgi:DNA-binding transcriptional regulator PaaX
MLATAIVAPNILQLLKPENTKKKYQYKKIIEKLSHNKIIYLFGERIELTKKGQDLLRKIQIEDIKIKPPARWNNVWHLVCYDIPEEKKKERDYFRKTISELGFEVIQDSLWVYPYNCKEEIAVISQNLGISPHVAYLNTDYLPQQNKLIKLFNLDTKR